MTKERTGDNMDELLARAAAKFDRAWIWKVEDLADEGAEKVRKNLKKCLTKEKRHDIITELPPSGVYLVN